jgi:geranylgeranyl reductase family protein
MESGEKVYDAAVVGAGPAGCSCALFLANAGREVLLLDKSASFPREKVCGDAFSGKSIGIARELGVLDSLAKKPHGIVRGLALVAPNGKRVSVPFPNADGMDFAGYTVARADTDEVFHKAAAAHPKIRAVPDFTANGLLRDAGGAVRGVAGTLGAGRKAAEFCARVVVGADGAASAIARLLGMQNVPMEHVYSAVRGYWDGAEGLTGDIELFFIDGVLPGYLWIFPMGGSRANVGLGILSSDVKPGRHPMTVLLEAVEKHPAVAPRFKNARLDGKVAGWSIPLGSHVRKAFGNGWLLAGDAAALVNPFSGEGVGNALCSGKYAAQAIGSAIAAQPGSAPLPEASLAAYGKSLEEYIRPEMEEYYRLQRMCRSRFLLNLFIGKAADKPAVRQMLVGMVNSEEEKKKAASPLFFLRMLLP